MQSLSILHVDQDGFRPASAALGPESAALAQLKALHELDQKSILSSMEANAVRRKEQGNRAMEKSEYRHAVKEYSHALRHAQDMMDFLEVEKFQPMNGYQLRALAKGVPLPGRGPAALQPFRAVVLASRALAFLRLDAYDRAAQDAELACQLEPRFLKAWIRRAAALAAANLRSEALEVLDEALCKACPTDLLREQVCKLIVNLRNLVNVEVKEPEKDLPVIFAEADQAQRNRPEESIAREERRSLGIYQGHREVQVLATLESLSLACRATISKMPTSFLARRPALSQETRARLYPKTPSANRHVSAGSDAFVSRLVNLAIDFKGDAATASREGPRYLRRGQVREEVDFEVHGSPGHWQEGVSSVQDLDLLQFWLALPDKARLGVLMKPEQARRVIQEYVAGKGAAERVSRAFTAKFGYETRDVTVLFRFWQSMPNNIRAGLQVRGYSNHEACRFSAPTPPQSRFLRSHLEKERGVPGDQLENFRRCLDQPGMFYSAMVISRISSLLRAKNGLGYLMIISIQFGIQPLLAKQFIHRDCVTSSLVFCAEMAKVVGCLAIMFLDDTGKRCFRNWKLQDCLLAAGIPSVTYVVQNFCVQVAYQNLDAVVFNVLNQSKVLFTALFSFLISGRRQSLQQCVALVLVTAGGILVSIPDSPPAQADENSEKQEERRFLGLVCSVVGAALSGLGSGIAEWALQRRGRNSFLLSLELASMGCTIIGTTSLLGLSPDSVRMREHGPFAGWTLWTWVPVLCQGLSGIIVGIITQVAGGVRKVMATICGLILTCVLQQALFGMHLTWLVLAAVPLVASGIYLHASFPPPSQHLSHRSQATQTLTLTSPVTTPRGQGKRRDISALARSRPRVDALDFVRAIAKRFPEDKTLKHMLKQCLEGDPSAAAADTDAYNLLVDTTVLKQASRDKTPKPAAGQLDARLKLKVPQEEGSFQTWLSQDADRAGRFLHLLQDASKVSRKIRSYMRHRAKQCLERGARLGPTGPVVPARNRTEADLPALYVIEDTFAHLCRRFGANEVYIRFGPYYLCRTVNDSKETKPLIEEIPDSTSGGAVVDCPTHGVSCGPRISAAEPDQKTGWHPNIASPEFSSGGSWWQMDLGRLHSCTGLRLEWSVPTIKKVTYATHAEFQSDLLLATGDGHQIVVTQVRDGGRAFLHGVKPGDVLQLNAGGSTDAAFVGLSPADAMAKIVKDFTPPLTLVFKGTKLSGDNRRLQSLLQQPLKVRVLVSKKHVAPSTDAPGEWEQVLEQEVTATTQHPSIVPSIFVARWVQLRFDSAWPKLDNEALAVSVKVMKVWRLAPPLFRQQFLENLRQVERQAAKGHALVRQPDGRKWFWASSVKRESFNMMINMDIVRRVKRSHDSEGDEMLALQMMCMRDRKEFNILRSDEMLALRQRIFTKEEDVLECTFHPRTAANVPGHVYKFRERISERMDASKVTGVKDFVKELGEEFKAHKYPNYWKVSSRVGRSVMLVAVCGSGITAE
ncbi:ROCK1 [Symbiodinium necroappetens]|uniref:ROCK1 protein n=1 Tax=Symbiodinium necroappetens TaxID=1628268 RepID=A0A813AHJ7_9DINO|nr:ROCK1 [Symbiodinium necroappetens]